MVYRLGALLMEFSHGEVEGSFNARWKVAADALSLGETATWPQALFEPSRGRTVYSCRWTGVKRQATVRLSAFPRGRESGRAGLPNQFRELLRCGQRGTAQSRGRSLLVQAGISAWVMGRGKQYRSDVAKRE